jgi:hypothetical protein
MPHRSFQCPNRVARHCSGAAQRRPVPHQHQRPLRRRDGGRAGELRARGARARRPKTRHAHPDRVRGPAVRQPKAVCRTGGSTQSCMGPSLGIQLTALTGTRHSLLCSPQVQPEGGKTFGDVCNFIALLAEAGVQVECTGECECYRWQQQQPSSSPDAHTHTHTHDAYGVMLLPPASRPCALSCLTHSRGPSGREPSEYKKASHGAGLPKLPRAYLPPRRALTYQRGGS